MELKQTPLNKQHKELGGRMVPFAGWEMPVQYSSIIQEHNAVRTKAGLFDVSHMGEILVQGKDALSFLEYMTCNKLAGVVDGRVQYNAIMNEAGGLVDDVTIYKESDESFFIVANAANYIKVFKHLNAYADSYSVELKNQSDSYHQLALQGPEALAIWEALSGRNEGDLKYYRFKDIELEGAELRISRTGYTGEDGLEIYSAIEPGVALWAKLLEIGQDKGLLPVGLGARDTLRLEAMYPLYGHELNETWTPVESGIGWIVKKEQDQFLGSDRVGQHKEHGPAGRVVPFVLEERGVPRDGMPVLGPDGQELGKVLSGTHSPSLKQGIGTAYLPIDFCKSGTSIAVSIRDRAIPARVQKGAFWKGTAGGG